MECWSEKASTPSSATPGGAILPAYDALKHSKIHHILVRHEQGATHMADGYARATGGVGVAVAPQAPARPTWTGIATAMMDSSAIVFITGQVGETLRLRRLPGNRHHRRHAANYEAQLFDHQSRQSRHVAAKLSTWQNPDALAQVLIDITKDAQQSNAEFDWEAAAPKMRGYRPDLSPAKAEYVKALELDSKTPSAR